MTIKTYSTSRVMSYCVRKRAVVHGERDLYPDDDVSWVDQPEACGIVIASDKNEFTVMWAKEPWEPWQIDNMNIHSGTMSSSPNANAYWSPININHNFNWTCMTGSLPRKV